MDEKLQNRFDALRREEAASTPGYEQLLHREEREQRDDLLRGQFKAGWRWMLAAAFAVLALFWIIPNQPPPERLRIEPFSPSQWTMPTDVLLITPGSELLRQVPSIGTDPLFPSVLPRTEAPWRMPG